MANKNYFDLCNEILVELFYEKVDTFDELADLTEGIKVKQDLNSALTMICNSENQPWRFREVTTDISLVPGVQQYENVNGYIDYIKYVDVPIVLEYIPDHEYLPISTGMPLNYWMDNECVKLYPIPDDSQLGRILKVKLYTNNFAKNKCGVYKPLMEKEDDEPIIPPHHRDILKWKVCADWRANFNDAKAAFYEKRFRKAYTNMVSDQLLTKDFPAGFEIMSIGNPANRSIMNAFYNPRVRRIV